MTEENPSIIDQTEFDAAIKKLIDVQLNLQFQLEPLHRDLEALHAIMSKQPLKFEDAGDIMLLMRSIFDNVAPALDFLTRNNKIWLRILNDAGIDLTQLKMNKP